jgi:hypothetical protein
VAAQLAASQDGLSSVSKYITADRRQEAMRSQCRHIWKLVCTNQWLIMNKNLEQGAIHICGNAFQDLILIPMLPLRP